MNEKINTQTIMFPYIIDYDLLVKSMKNIVYLVHLLRYNNKPIFKYPIILNENINEDENSEFILRLNERIDIYYKFTSILITDYYSSFEWFAYKSEPATNECYYNTQIFKTSFHSSFIISKFVYSKKLNPSIEDVNREKKKRLNVIVDFVMRISEEIYKFNIESICINCNINLIWNILLNFKVVQKYVFFLGDKIEYKGKILKNNLKIKSYVNNEIIKYTVNKCRLKCGEGKIEFILDNSPNEKIQFLLRGNNEKTILYIFNLYKNKISEKELLSLSKRKIALLKKFKIIIENFNENYNTDLNILSKQ